MAKISFFLKWLQFAGFQQVPRILIYSISKSWQNRNIRKKLKKKLRLPWQTPGTLAGSEVTLNGARFRFERAVLNIDFLTAEMVRIFWEPGKQPYPYAIEKNDWPKIQTSLTKDEQGWQLGSASLSIKIDPSGRLFFHNDKGEPIRSESCPEWRGDAEIISWQSRVRLKPEECLYGLGEQSGPLNLRGTVRHMWNTDPKGGVRPGKDPVYMPLPVYMSLQESGSYLIFYENSFPAIFDFTAPSKEGIDTINIAFEGGALRYYLISGTLSDSLRLFTQLTGRPEIPPKWALGYHHSRWGYKNEQDIREVVAGFASHDMPVSAIHLDIDHMDGFRTLSVNQNRFPDLKRLAEDLGRQAIKLVTIVNPGVKRDPEYRLFQEGLQESRFITFKNGKPVTGVVWPGWSAYPDFTDPKTRSWWKSQYQHLIDSEIAGFWHDMNEPTSFSFSRDMDLPLESHHKFEGMGGDHRQAHNLYGLLMNRAGFEAMREYRPDRRPWLLSRSGWVSQQRYGWNWTGDVESSWEAMRMTISTVLGQGLCGLPYSGPDIGGFSGDPDGELYVRWFQMATFLPFFRTHSAITTSRREPWIFGNPYTAIIRDYLKFRYRLLPYFYSLAWQTSQTGLPIVRPIFWLDPTDKDLWEVDDAFLLGDNLLIAPIFHPNSSFRQIRLPKGKWYSWWNNAEYRGPGMVEIPVSLEEIPILVRSGSLVPLDETGELHLHLFPPDPEVQSSPLILYNDYGDGYGVSRLDRFQMERTEKYLKITCQGEGEFPVVYNTISIRLHNVQGQAVLIDDIENELQNNCIQTKSFSNIKIEF